MRMSYYLSFAQRKKVPVSDKKGIQCFQEVINQRTRATSVLTRILNENTENTHSVMHLFYKINKRKIPRFN